ncbi:MAG: P22 coat protein - protein 5 domain protein [Clostridia bacterium]|nr:P22 coat protein - protein 5 domain protein [Clostridia bacterium]
MAINNFIPTVWSETLYQELDRAYIGVRNCNRDFEGDIRGKGDTVKICGVGAVSVFDYTKNTDMSAPETLSDTVRTLTIDRAKGFNFQIDDIDRAQQSPKLMGEAMRVAADALANAADQVIYSLYSEAKEENTVSGDGVTYDGMLDLLIEARKRLIAAGVTSNEVVLEVSPDVAALILKAKILTSDNNDETLESGYIGSFVGFRVYVSSNIAQVETDGKLYHKCIARTRRAVAFAEQLSEINAYRPEKRFADAVKGLHLYGAKLIYPAEFVLLDLNLAA